MKRTGSFLFGLAGCLAVAAFGCGGSGAAKPAGGDGGRDLGSDGGDAARPPGVACPAAAPGEQRGLGACCGADGDCGGGGTCWNGFCTRTCDATTACGVVTAPSPFPVGTALACASNRVGDPFSYCLPGSLAACTGAAAGPGACPAGEACGLALDPLASSGPSAGTAPYAGLCLATMVAGTYLPAGSPCDPAEPYACENQGGFLGSGCFNRRCTRACARSQDCPLGMICGPPPFSAKWGGATAFGNGAAVDLGICQGRFCGQVHGEAGLAAGAVVQQGADSDCVTGEVCAPTTAVGPSGDTAYLSCVPPLPAAQVTGASCGASAGTGTDAGAALAKHCADDHLCISWQGVSFCSQLCRRDADCATGSVCADGGLAAPLPNGSTAPIAMCIPQSRVAGTVCQAEKDCPRGSACLPFGTHSSLLVCRPAIGSKNVGDRCAAPSDCRSGQCADRDGNPPSANNRAFCAAFCGKNSDCAPSQLCLRRVLSNNGTIDDPRDDVVLGLCTTLQAPALTGACTTDDNCTGQTAADETGGDACDLANQTCFTKGAHIGDPCAHRADCPLGAYCHLGDPNFEGGVCLSLGCDPAATSGVDACPTGAVCLERSIDAPLFGCYQACQPGTACARLAEGYSCQPAIASAPAAAASATICLTPGGP